ncbi:hypothetical protein BS643_10915 [Pseudomonas protegens]|jgi:hypothetical protein|uniref:Uncharacterized protein n=1 Tax=Pseudomonas fluorescens (strain ATCC BAA-477 / NRRL B-23932 / Pf-5) TaxID=220664 RepID=Q4KGI2_PSEF5|nr:conserved hypothetical protein [Pseudomonas protegens Pf-5]OKK46060.1 hypothetical protein BS643_10915 [Pseudomonas protegens]OKK61056.1 hypothetical protein BS645_06335 [Pseudomonas protegens]OKK65591.1 hypothetical protein BS646_16990 [Pseudomonas protegens]
MIIGPAVKAAQALGIATDGPYPGDTIFLKVQGDARPSRSLAAWAPTATDRSISWFPHSHALAWECFLASAVC